MLRAQDMPRKLRQGIALAKLALSALSGLGPSGVGGQCNASCRFLVPSSTPLIYGNGPIDSMSRFPL